MTKNLYTIDDFCQRNSQTRRRLDRLWARGIGPRRTYIGGRVFVSAKDEQAWLDLMANPTGKAAKLAEATQTMMHEKALHAARAGRLAGH
jgi:hypothetical protein